MKKILTLILICFISSANAQTGMLNGTGYAPDISVSDINGNTHNLYSYLNSNKVVVLELMSTSCGYCQQYAAGTENSYQVYGPNGLDVAKFIALEVNAATSDNDLANFATTYGVSFPMCNGISPSTINYQLYYIPSYYVIYPDSSYVTFCPTYCQTTSSSSTIENLLNNAVQAWLTPVYGCTDPLALNYDSTATNDDGSCDYTSYTIKTIGSAFSPDTIICDLGDTINFILGGYHNAVEVSNSTWLAAGTTSNGGFSFGYGATGQFIANTAQTYYYVCQPHVTSGMKGIIIVNALPIYGCTDPIATNYDPLATIDDGTCSYLSHCTNPSPTGAYVSELIHDRVRVNWDNMNDVNCMVTQYRIKYRELGTSTWSQKNMANTGLCQFGLNTTSKKIVGLTASTTYEYYMKAWYCGGTTSSWSAIQNFTTLDECENVINFAVSTPTNTKASFTWDSTGAYSFARIKLREDITGGVWTSAGGFGVFYPALSKNKNGLTPGTSYRAQARTWCDPTGGAYRSATWSPLVFWSQPTSVKLEGGSAINNLTIYPNPSRDLFNISFTSDAKQNLRVRILNVIGEELLSDNLEQFIGEYAKQISLIDNAKGIYFLEIETNDGIINKKLILQ
jgi:plastocyanin